MSTGDKVVAIALREVGVRENPRGSNSGTRIREYQASTDLRGTGWPWCAAYVEWVWKAAGVSTAVCSPSTQVFADRAKAAGLTGKAPRPGAAFIVPGIHMGLLVAPAGGTVWHTVEGNSGDAVSRRVRDIRGLVIVVPTELGAAVQALRSYWFSDPAAKDSQALLGPWRGKRGLAHARKVAAKRPAWQQARVRQVAPQRFGVLTGQRSIYGPWATAAQRDAALAVIHRRVGRTLRAYSTAVPVAGASAQALGKTT